MISPSENGVSVEPGAADARTAELERLLHDDEIIILAVKPSSWFVLLVSLPVLWVLVALAFPLGTLRSAATMACVAWRIAAGL